MFLSLSLSLPLSLKSISMSSGGDKKKKLGQEEAQPLGVFPLEVKFEFSIHLPDCLVVLPSFCTVSWATRTSPRNSKWSTLTVSSPRPRAITTTPA